MSGGKAVSLSRPAPQVLPLSRPVVPLTPYFLFNVTMLVANLIVIFLLSTPSFTAITGRRSAATREAELVTEKEGSGNGNETANNQAPVSISPPDEDATHILVPGPIAHEKNEENYQEVKGEGEFTKINSSFVKYLFFFLLSPLCC